MKHEEMRNQNAINIFNSVKNGKASVEEIMNDTGLSHVTVKDIGNLLCENKILISYKQLHEGKGRPTYNYKINKELYSVYMLEDKYSYIFIAMNYCGNVILRHDYYKRTSLTFEENLKRALNSILLRPDYISCINFFAECTDKTASLLPNEIIRINKEEFITKTVPHKNKTVIIEFSDRCYLSLYGHIHNTNAKIKGIERVIKCDEIISYKKDCIKGIFDALENATLSKMEELILNLE